MIIKATEEHFDFLIKSLLELVKSIKDQGTDLYTERLPEHSSEALEEMVRGYFGQENKFALVYLKENQPAGALLADLRKSSMPEIMPGRIGRIFTLYVTDGFRKAGVGAELIAEAEKRFAEMGVDMVELSFMSSNVVAANYWRAKGYRPFRVFSYKKLTGDKDL